MLTYKVLIRRRAMKDIARLPSVYSRRISERIDSLAETPRPAGMVMLTAQVGARLRVGPYRILYVIDDAAREVTIYRVKHRREVYR